MPILKFDHVVSCSSEDKNFPAENLLTPNSFKKWKCTVSKERRAVVILQLEKSSRIEAIDIGNENSAFIEVLVGRSTNADEFKVLLVSSSFMSPMEGRNGSNKHRVRLFCKEQLSKPAVDEKWDRIKIACTQPFNRSAQYGLTFITLHSAGEKVDEVAPATSFGRFVLKTDEDNGSLSVGSFFARRKEMATEDALKRATVTRTTTSPAGIIRFSNTNNRRQEKDQSYSGMKNSKVSSKSLVEKASVIKRRPTTPGETKISTNATNGTPTKRPSNSQDISYERLKKINKSNEKLIIRRVFEKLLDGVVLVISGYQNPHRGTVRSMALDMGAKYKQDWDSSCTHLICAFPNTPKFQQVRGKGHIVHKKWIEDCHSRRRRLPWRRYALDKRDQGKPESEEEILEDIPQRMADNGIVLDENETLLEEVARAVIDGSGSDTEEEIERIRAAASRDKDQDATDDEDEDNKSMCPTTSHLPWPQIATFFTGYCFFFHPNLPLRKVEELKRYILAYNGTIAPTMTPEVTHVLAPRGEDINRITNQWPHVLRITPSWIWRCSDENKLLTFNTK